MKMRKKALIRVLALACASALMLCAAAALAAEKTYNFTTAHGIYPTVPNNPIWYLFKEKLETYSKGRIKLQIRDSGTLCSEGSCVEQLAQKGIDMAALSTGNFGAYSTNFYVLDMPYLFESREDAKKVATGPIGDFIKKRLEEKQGIKCLWIVTSYGYRNLYNNVREVKVPADTKGIKIRTVMSPITQNLVKGWGATPINVPWAELYQALQTKVVNGFYLPEGYVLGRKFYEVAKFCTETGGLFNFRIGLMDLAKYKALPEDLRLVVDQAAKEVEEAEYFLDAVWSENAKAELIKNGVKFYTPTPEERKLWAAPAMKIWDMFKDKIDQDVLKAIEMVQLGAKDKSNNQRLKEIAEKRISGK